MNRPASALITHQPREVAQPDPEDFSSLTDPLPARKWVFSCLKGPVRKSHETQFSDSVSGFIAEPSQSANVRTKSRGRPNRQTWSAERGDGVCSFCESQNRCHAVLPKRAVRPKGVKRRSRPCVHFIPPRRLTVEDSGLSSRECGCESRRGGQLVRTSAGP